MTFDEPVVPLDLFELLLVDRIEADWAPCPLVIRHAEIVKDARKAEYLHAMFISVEHTLQSDATDMSALSHPRGGWR